MLGGAVLSGDVTEAIFPVRWSIFTLWFVFSRLISLLVQRALVRGGGAVLGAICHCELCAVLLGEIGLCGG